MRITRKALQAALAAAAVAVVLAGCTALDVVGTTAVTTFKALVEKEASAISLDSATGRWALASPGGERFEWSSSFAVTGPDFLVSFDAKPWTEAGLDPARLPAGLYSFDPASGRLSLAFEFGSRGSAAGSPLESFSSIVKEYRPRIGYHAALDHYGIALGDGNMFEWAKDMAKNDKDIVFVLNPAPLIEAGVDPAKITGWVFAKVPVKDAAGKDVQVDKFLKPYNLP
jgi:hypothetical protein